MKTWMIEYQYGDGARGDKYACKDRDDAIRFCTEVVGSLCNVTSADGGRWIVVSPAGHIFVPVYYRSLKNADNYVELIPEEEVD